jgi:hypothetical protein
VQTSGENADLSISPDKSLFLADPTSKAEWIGAPSNGAQVMLQRLKELELAMQHLAPVQLQQKSTTGVEAAAAKKLDRAQSDSQLSVIVTQLEDALNQALAIAALYFGIDPVELKLSRDFTPDPMEASEVKEWAALVVAGQLSQDTFLRKLAAAEAFDALDEWSVEEEVERIQEEAPEPVAAELPPEELEEPDEAEEEDEEKGDDQLDGAVTPNETNAS